ncbi:MAG: hypothetical protein AAB513_02325 [Patescibacteria group bacterium]
MDGSYYSVPIIPWDSILWGLYTIFVDGSEKANKEDVIIKFLNFYETFSFASSFVSMILIVGIGYCLFRLYQIRTIENRELQKALHNFHHKAEGSLQNESPGFHKWQQVQAHATSESANEWRLAILEADIMLDKLVYDQFDDLGDTLGERLKKVDRSDFQTIDKAWEAHRIRNSIAHEGSNFELSEREMRHVLKLYEDVFNEFQYI